MISISRMFWYMQKFQKVLEKCLRNYVSIFKRKNLKKLTWCKLSLGFSLVGTKILTFCLLFFTWFELFHLDLLSFAERHALTLRFFSRFFRFCFQRRNIFVGTPYCTKYIVQCTFTMYSCWILCYCTSIVYSVLYIVIILVHAAWQNRLLSPHISPCHKIFTRPLS